MHRLCEFTNGSEFTESNPSDVTEKWRKMAMLVREVVDKYDGIKVPDYEQVCSEVDDSYLLGTSLALFSINCFHI